MEEFILTLIHQLPEPWGIIALVVLSGIGAAAVTAANAPREKLGGNSKVWSVIDWIAQNYNKAKNEQK